MRYWNWALLLWLTFAAVFVLWQLIKHSPAMVGVAT